MAVEDPPSASATSFADLYRETVRDVYAYVATIVGDRAAAEDVVAAAYERAYRKRAKFDPRRGSPRAWVFGIARNAALDELRRRKRTATLVEEPPDAAASGDDTELAAQRATVRAALLRLDPRDREIVALKFHGDLTNAEVAKLLGLSESNAGTRLHRAMTKLREACDA
ncbi:MAG TPA: sigma-70 family RNA polymerase sigma factor [Solirubrobacteraceae bacterium]|nr:sigma-70 family RNA polymerase sigma factor [Solirubrobacteraceae bacterium]